MRHRRRDFRLWSSSVPVVDGLYMDDWRVVVGIDGSTSAREALRWACRLVPALGGEIVLVHALGLLEPLHGELVGAHRRRAAIEDVVTYEWCAALRDDEVPHRIVIREGHPVDVLTGVAQDEAADLVVVGSRGVGSTLGLELGSTSLHLLQVAPCPVLVVPDREQGAPHLILRRILLAVDSSGPGDDAMTLTCRLAATFDAWITMVHVIEGEATGPAWDRARLLPSLGRMRAQGVPVDLCVQRGVPHEVVGSVAAAIDADLVVLETRHAGDPDAPLLDSVSRQVARVAHRPTLVLPADLTTAPAGADQRLMQGLSG